MRLLFGVVSDLLKIHVVADILADAFFTAALHLVDADVALLRVVSAGEGVRPVLPAATELFLHLSAGTVDSPAQRKHEDYPQQNDPENEI